MTKLEQEQLEDLVAGCAFLGSGGGGSIHAGDMFVKAIVANGGVQLTDAVVDGVGCVMADIGANSAFSADQVQALTNCFQMMQDFLNGKGANAITCLYPVETGPENTLAPMVLASSLGIPVFDGDGAGRAVPEIQLCTFAAQGISASPLALTNGGKDGVLAFAQDAADMDRMLRPLTATPQFGDSASMALFSGLNQELATGAVKGTVTTAIALGSMLRLIAKGNPVPAGLLGIVNSRKGALLAKGKVTSVEDSVAGDFDMGRVTISEELTDATITIYTQNENLVAYSSLQGHPLASAPHSICYLRSDMTAVTNAEIKNGNSVWLIAVMADDALITPTMLTGFSQVLADIGYAGQAGVCNGLPPTPLGDLILGLAGK